VPFSNNKKFFPFQIFRTNVAKVLTEKFGSDVDTSHKKVITIKANGNRRVADVRVCRDFRRYRKYAGAKSRSENAKP
jgi:hypothetical protein